MKNALAASVKDVRAIAMHKYSVCVHLIVGISRYMLTPIDDTYANACLGQFTSHYAAGKARADNKNVR